MTGVARLLENCALTPDDIARRTDLDLARVHQILSGARLTMDELRALSSGLQIPLHAFSRGILATSRSDKLRALYRTGKQHDDFSPPVERIAEYVTSALRILPKAKHSKALVLRLSRQRNDLCGSTPTGRPIPHGLFP